jgi:hypothetical protein
MYEVALLVHSWLRWVALIAGVLAVVGSAGSRGTLEPRDRWGLIFIIALDLQLVLGLILYFGLSPNTAAILQDFGAAMRDRVARFWAVEHATLMFASVVVAHVGRVLARKAVSPQARRSRLFLAYTVSLVAMLIAIPWPGMSAGRPLFRF